MLMRAYMFLFAAYTKVWLYPSVLVIYPEVGVERIRLWTWATAGDSKGVKQLLQILSASDTVEETNGRIQELILEFNRYRCPDSLS